MILIFDLDQFLGDLEQLWQKQYMDGPLVLGALSDVVMTNSSPSELFSHLENKLNSDEETRLSQAFHDIKGNLI